MHHYGNLINHFGTIKSVDATLYNAATLYLDKLLGYITSYPCTGPSGQNNSNIHSWKIQYLFCQ